MLSDEQARRAWQQQALAVGRVDGLVDFYSLPHGVGPVLRRLQRQRAQGATGGAVGAERDEEGVPGEVPGEVAGTGGEEEGHATAKEEELMVWRCATKGHSMLINRICWHPSEQPSAWGWRRCATAGDDGLIYVVRPLALMQTGAGQEGEGCDGSGSWQPNGDVGEEVEVVLRGHEKPVAGLDWCPATSRWLASASFDFTAQVWDAAAGEALYSLRGHYGRVFCVRWGLQPAASAAAAAEASGDGGGAGAPLEEVWGVYTGSDDQSVRWWHLERDGVKGAPPSRTAQGAQIAALMKQRTKRQKSDRSAGGGAAASGGGDARKTDAGVDNEGESRAAGRGGSSLPTQDGGDDAAVKVAGRGEGGGGGGGVVASGGQYSSKKERKSLLATDGGEEETLEARALKKQEEDAEHASKTWGQSLLHTLLGLGGIGAGAADCPLASPDKSPADARASLLGRAQMTEEAGAVRREMGPVGFDASLTEDELREVLRGVARRYEGKGDWDRAAACAHFGGDLARVLCAAAEQRALSASLVAQAPALGLDAWAAASRLLAKQLEERHFYHQAASHFLACHQVIDAIAVYRRAGLWRDALALARARLPRSSPVLSSLWMSWGRALQGRHLPAQAAQCFMRAGAPQAAVDVLVREALSLDCAASSSSGHWAGRMAMLRAATGLSRALALPVPQPLAQRVASALLLRGAHREAARELLAPASAAMLDGGEAAVGAGQDGGAARAVAPGWKDGVTRSLVVVAGAALLVDKILSEEEAGGSRWEDTAGAVGLGGSGGEGAAVPASLLWQALLCTNEAGLVWEQGGDGMLQAGAGWEHGGGREGQREAVCSVSDASLDAAERLMVEEGGNGRGGRAMCALALVRWALKCMQAAGMSAGTRSRARSVALAEP